MNLSMQTRRAFVTLSLAAMALVFVMAKASIGADAQARMGDDAPVRTEAVFVEKETFATPVVAPARIAAPLLMTKERSTRKTMRTRCESVSNI